LTKPRCNQKAAAKSRSILLLSLSDSCWNLKDLQNKWLLTVPKKLGRLNQQGGWIWVISHGQT